MAILEAPTRIEAPSEAISDLLPELSSAAATPGKVLHPRTAANLAALARITNAYDSNLIEGHATRPSDIERALDGQFDSDSERRNLQLEAAAQVNEAGLLASDNPKSAVSLRFPADALVILFPRLFLEI